MDEKGLERMRMDEDGDEDRDEDGDKDGKQGGDSFSLPCPGGHPCQSPR